MKWILLTLVSFFLTGCPSPADRAPATYDASATLHGSDVCITVTAEGDEKLEAITIYKLDEPENREIKFLTHLYAVTPNQCLPNMNYIFTENNSYHVSVKLTSTEKYNKRDVHYSRVFVTEFSLKKTNGNLQIINLP